MRVMELKKVSIALMMMGISGVMYGQLGDVKYSCHVGEVGFGGYDLISYFDENPLKGKKQYSTTYEGIVLTFANQQNLKKFLVSPKRYMPAYGGWCATGVVHNNLIVPNFAMYKIQNDQILFFETRGFFNGFSQWEKDSLKNEFLADRNFRESLDKGKNIAD